MFGRFVIRMKRTSNLLISSATTFLLLKYLLMTLYNKVLECTVSVSAGEHTACFGAIKSHIG